MGDISIAKLALEQLQEAIHATYPLSIQELFKSRRENSSDIHREFIKEAIEQWRETLIPDELENLYNQQINDYVFSLEDGVKPPTALDNESQYRSLNEMAREIEKAAHELGRTIPLRPTFGTLPIGRPNAMAIPIESKEECLIVFQHGLFMYCYLMFKSILSSMTFSTSDDGRYAFDTSADHCIQNIEQNPLILNRFVDVVLNTLYDEAFGASAAERYWLDRPYIFTAETITTAIELFVLGHEYGHIISGHLNSSTTVRAMIGGQEFEELIHDWHQELEADVRGVELCVKAMNNRGFDFAMSYWGADIFFSCLAVLERSVSTALTGEIIQQYSGSHPPAELRRAFLRERISQSVPEEYAKSAIQLASETQQVVEYLWDKTYPILRQAHSSGLQLALLWAPS